MRRPSIAAVLAALLAAAGCSKSDPDAARTAPPAAIPPLTAPLTDDNVEEFLAIIAKLPGETVPEFCPPEPWEADERLSAVELVNLWRREFQHACSPEVQARLWNEDAALRRAFERSRIDPEALAALLVRLSAAATREALDDRIDLPRLREQADRALKAVAAELHALPGTGTGESREEARRNQLILALREAIAFREFVRLLEKTPAESAAVVARHRERLAPHLPTQTMTSVFEQRFDSEATVLQAGHETPVDPAPARARKPSGR
ncbi:MAG: hypothetical protein KF774_21950 [Planctomyces sp.]|nr:hypothetical protein [Planctomyces sp.]